MYIMSHTFHRLIYIYTCSRMYLSDDLLVEFPIEQISGCDIYVYES